MAVSVNIICKDNQISPAPISGVTVNIYDPSNSYAFVASAISDVNGQAAFLIPGAVAPDGKTYEVRVYKMGIIFPNPVQIQVLEPLPNGQTNNFTIQATGIPSVLPVSSDQRCCRCTGVFLDYSNRPLVNMLVYFYPNPEAGFEVPSVVDGNLIAADQMTVYTDANGKISIDLIRGGEYNIVWAGQEDTPWNFVVPDQSSANLINLIHPFPISLSYDQDLAPGNVIDVGVGTTTVLEFTVTFSDGQINPDSLNKWIKFSFPSTVPFAAIWKTSQRVALLYITGISAGSDHIAAGLVDSVHPARVPNAPFTAPSLLVNVTP